MDSLYLFGAKSIKSLQSSLPGFTNYFVHVSEVADPANAFSVAFPISCIINLRLGANVLAASVAAEWTNILLKWCLMEHRPYWWVNLAPNRPLLEQTRLTCETGPGSPSGHLTGITAVLYAVAQWLCKSINEETLIGRVNKKRLNKIIWLLVWIALINISLSRMYHATHFPHQCFLGIAAGFLIGYLVTGAPNKSPKWWIFASKSELLLISFLMAVIGIIAYLFQILIGLNPDWSILLASQWCSKVENLHVNTMPLFSLVRDIGSTCGIALSSPISKRVACPYNRSISAVLTFFTCTALQKAMKAIPTADPKVFYSCYFMLNVTQPYFMLAIIPYVSYSLSSLANNRL